MAKYGVTGFPTLLVLDGDGKLLRRVPVLTRAGLEILLNEDCWTKPLLSGLGSSGIRRDSIPMPAGTIGVNAFQWHSQEEVFMAESSMVPPTTMRHFRFRAAWNRATCWRRCFICWATLPIQHSAIQKVDLIPSVTVVSSTKYFRTNEMHFQIFSLVFSVPLRLCG